MTARHRPLCHLQRRRQPRQHPGRFGDRHGAASTLVLGVGLFGLAYLGFAAGPTVSSRCCLASWRPALRSRAWRPPSTPPWPPWLPPTCRGSAFGLLAAVQSFGTLVASGIAGLLWTAVSPTTAFVYLAAWMVVSVLVLLATATGRPAPVTAPTAQRFFVG